MKAHVAKMITKYKKPLIVFSFIFGYAMFWWWFFGREKDVAVQDSTAQDVVQEVETTEQQVQDERDDGFESFGTFWIAFSIGDKEIKAPIVDGVTEEKLAEGVGHHKTTAYPNTENGNVVLSGHRWKFGRNPAYKIFEDLDQLDIGDKIIVHYAGRDYIYEIFENKTVQDDAIEILDQTDEPMLTVYTCTPKFTAFRRLVYRARLIEG
jgi:sortase A